MTQRISSKLIFIVAVALASILIIGVFSYFLVTSHERAQIAQIELNAHQLSETVKNSTKQDMLLTRRDRVHRTINTIAEQEGIENIRIFNKQGSIIFASDKSVIGKMVDKQAEACFACHAADSPLEKLTIPDRTRIFGAEPRNLGIINPIYNEPSCWQGACHAHQPAQKVLGVLDVTMSLQQVDRQIAADRNKVLLLTLTAVLAISLLIWSLFETLVGKPVAQLVRATRAVADGDLNYQIPVRRNDELGHLGSSFNSMIRKLADAQAQLYQSDKLASLGRLAAGVAHEINNPLTAVLSYSSLLVKRAKDDAEMRDDLETIVRESKRCREIVKQLLDFSRQVPLKKTRIDLTEVIANALRIVRNRLVLDNISVHTTFADGLPPVTADANQMLQVFINLLVNAADAIGKEGGEIAISGHTAEAPDGREIVLTVKDNGCGIPAESVSKVFEPFYTTKAHAGTGLGLAVVWGIIDKHGGRIRIESEVEQGTTVTIRLPLTQSAPVTSDSAGPWATTSSTS